MPVNDLEVDQLQIFEENMRRTRARREAAARLQAQLNEEPEDKESPGVVGDVAKGVVGGARDAVVGAIDSVMELARISGEHGSFGTDDQLVSPSMFVNLVRSLDRLKGEEVSADETLPDVSDPKTAAGSVAKGITQFATNFIPVVKGMGGLKSATKIGEIAKATIAGAAADYTAFDPLEARLSDLAKDLGFDNPVINYLAVDEDDSAVEGRIKNVLEGAGIGLAFDGVLQGVRGLRAWRKSQATAALNGKAAKAVDEKVSQIEYHRGLEKEAEDTLASIKDGADNPNTAAIVSETKAAAESQLEAIRGAREEAEAALDAFRGTQIYADLPKETQEALEAHVNVPRTDASPTTPSRTEGPNAIRDASGEVDPERVAARVEMKPAKGFGRFTSEVHEAMVEALQRDDTSVLESAIAGDNLNLANLGSDVEIESAVGRIAEVISEHRPKAREAVSLDKQQLNARKLAEEMGLEGDAVEGVFGKLQTLSDHNISATVTASRSLYQGMVLNADRLADEILATGGTLRQQGEFHQRLAQIHAFGSVLSQATENVGRGLGSFRILSEITDPKELQKALDTERTAKSAMETAAAFKVARLSGGKAVRELSQDISLGRRWANAGLEYFMGSILSGPTTHFVNISGNAGAAAWRTLEYAFHDAKGMRSQAANVAAVHAMAKNFFGSLKVSRAAQADALRAAGLSFMGRTDSARRLLASHGDAIGDATKAFITGDDQLIAGAKQFDFREGAISSDTLGLSKTNPLSLPLDIVGSVVRIPFHLLGGADEMFKAMNYNGAVARRAYKDGIDFGVDNVEEYASRVASDIRKLRRGGEAAFADDVIDADYLKHLNEVDKLAKNEAREATFTEDLTGFSKGIQDLTQAHPFVRLFVPFVRTPVNLLRFSFERFPGTMHFSSRYRAAKAAGDMKTIALMNSRMQLSSMMALGVGMAAYQGKITGGGPADPAARKQLEATGWQPYSIVTEGEDGSKRYTSYKRIDPLASTIGVTTDLLEISGDMDSLDFEETITALAAAFANNITNKSYFTGITALVEAINEPERRLDKLIRQYAGTVVPNFLNQTNQSLDGPFHDMDPTFREVKSYVDAVKARTPGYSQTLPPVRNMFGETVQRPPGIGWRAVSPFYRSEQKADPVSDELAHLARNGVSVVDMYRSYRSINGVELTPEQRDRYIVLSTQDTSGHNLRARLERVIASARYQRATPSDDGRGRFLKDEVRRWRSRGKQRLLQEDAQLREAVQAERQSRLEALRGGPLSQLLNQ